MTAVGELAIQTQRRVVAHFRDRPGYEYLASCLDRPDDRNETAALESRTTPIATPMTTPTTPKTTPITARERGRWEVTGK